MCVWRGECEAEAEEVSDVDDEFGEVELLDNGSLLFVFFDGQLHSFVAESCDELF